MCLRGVTARGAARSDGRSGCCGRTAARHGAKPPRTARRRKEPDTPSLAEDALNPAAWWHTLQQQFAQIAAGVDEKEPEARKATAKQSGKRKAR